MCQQTALAGRRSAPPFTVALCVPSMIKEPTAAEGEAETKLHAAAWAGDIDWAKQEIDRGTNVNVIDSIKETPLHGASAWGKFEMVEFLLSCGANPNIENDQGNTALHWACSHGNRGVLQLLIGNGAKLQNDGLGQSPLGIAKKHNNQEIILWLKENT